MAIGWLGKDPDAPFTFSLGERVAWQNHDGTPDQQLSGRIESGVCEYEPGHGSYNTQYVVLMDNGLRFGAGELDIVKIP